MSGIVFVRLLGQVTALRKSAAVALGSPRQRAVLAILATNAGQVVPTDRLIDDLWGERVPRSALQNLHTYVAGLRRALEPDRGPRAPAALLVAAPQGYRLDLDPRDVDSLLYDAYLHEARQLPAEAALALVERAGRLWRGTPLCGLPGPFAEAERTRLEELHLRVAETRGQLLLDLQRPDDAIDDLSGRIRLHPLRERLRELLMVALHQAGRTADALRVYEDGRRILADELGVAPGERLVRCHDIIRRAAPPAVLREHRAAPNQLPRDLQSFVGRHAETIRLRSVLAPWDGSPPPAVVAISGPPGAGKSALAVHAAHLAGDGFPDGRLFVSLQGATPGVEPLRPLDVIGRLLRALGEDREEIPREPGEAVQRLREVMAGQRILVVLDGAAGPAQIRPLLPLPAGCSVLVTSRESLSHIDDCVQVRLGRMPETEAFTLLAKLVGAERCAADPEHAERIVRLCGGLPLALRIAGARLADQPGWHMSVLADRLADERRRLQELQAGDLAVRTSFATSWSALASSDEALDRSAARALSLLGQLQVPDVTTDTAAAMLGGTWAEADLALERLASAHLLERGSSGRYHMHDLIRLFAAELAPAKRRSVLLRALGHFAATVRSAAVLADPHRVQAVAPEVRSAPLPLADATSAHEWLSREDTNLVAAASQALAEPDDEIARLGVAVVFGLHWHLHISSQAWDMLRLNERVLDFSRRLEDVRMALEAHNHVASALNALDRTDESLVHHRHQLELARLLGDRFCEQRAHANMAATLDTAQRYSEALEHSTEQLRIATEIGSEVGRRYALLSVGLAHLGLGRPEQARTSMERALESAHQAGDRWHVSIMTAKLGRIHLGLGNYDVALRLLKEGQELAQVTQSKITSFECALGLAQTHRLAGDLPAARRHLNEAAAILGRRSRRGVWEKEFHEEETLLTQAEGPDGGPRLAKII
ncbi:AfsR/SARP family transcriptional regulator [Nonomuraea soli]|uniref:DNA-binding SARP family transcriptional activator n=1 Tax=Nonomuraea soli TaxID=1032476 RepID=A0A7W0CDW4_9ACTN|nr:BTAD domain-containing putative transcriptional regulator [Nonomuraea soli]MBA2889339.1 DNA-binding SARP family transcriptional activator [Nonomuraea soli]